MSASGLSQASGWQHDTSSASSICIHIILLTSTITQFSYSFTVQQKFSKNSEATSKQHGKVTDDEPKKKDKKNNNRKTFQAKAEHDIQHNLKWVDTKMLYKSNGFAFSILISSIFSTCTLRAHFVSLSAISPSDLRPTYFREYVHGMRMYTSYMSINSENLWPNTRKWMRKGCKAVRNGVLCMRVRLCVSRSLLNTLTSKSQT